MIGLIEATARSVARESASSQKGFFSSIFGGSSNTSASNNNNSSSHHSRSNSSPFFSDDSSTAIREKQQSSSSNRFFSRPRLVFLTVAFVIILLTLFGVSQVLGYNLPSYLALSKTSSTSSKPSSASSGNQQSNRANSDVTPSFDLLHHQRNNPRHDASHHVVAEPHNNLKTNNNRKAVAAQQEGKGSSSSIDTQDNEEDCDKDHERKEHLKKIAKKINNNDSSSSSAFPIVDWHFKQGTIRMRLRPDAAPLTVANTLRLIREGKYNKTGCAYRYEKGFVMQFGLCSRIDHKTVPLEYKLPNEKYSVSMARSSNPHSGGTEFFINLANNTRGLGPHRKGGYAVFGEVIDGFETIKELKKLSVHSSAGKDKKTGRTKKGGLMLFDKPVPHLTGVNIVGE